MALLVATSALVSTARAGDGRSEAVPPAAAIVISAAAKAAQNRDFTALRKLMTDDFTWSFGGDADANQAIAEWKQDDKYLRALGRVLRNGCKPTKDNQQVECPGKGGLSFRAGFESTPNGWRMRYFVEGD